MSRIRAAIVAATTAIASVVGFAALQTTASADPGAAAHAARVVFARTANGFTITIPGVVTITFTVDPTTGAITSVTATPAAQNVDETSTSTAVPTTTEGPTTTAGPTTTIGPTTTTTELQKGDDKDGEDSAKPDPDKSKGDANHPAPGHGDNGQDHESASGAQHEHH